MNWIKVKRIVEITITIIFCAILIFFLTHFIYQFKYFKFLFILEAWLVYKIVKFISIRNKRLFIKTY